MGVRVPRQAPFARVTELVYVSDSNPDAERLVSSNLTSRTTYRAGVTAARSALTRSEEVQILCSVPHGSMAKLVKATDCKSVIARSNRAGTSNMQDDAGRLWHRSRKPRAAAMLWGSTPPSCATWSDTLTGKGPPR